MSTLSTHSPQAVLNSPSIKNLPVNLFGSVMGIAGLSLAWRLASHEFGASPYISATIGTIAVLVFVALGVGYLVKWIRHPAAVRGEFMHPIAGNFFGTITIAILLLSSVIAPISALLSETVWTIGTISTVILSFVIASRLLQGKIDAAHAVPAWLIPGVATLDITVAGGTMPMAWAHEVNLFGLAVGAMIALLFFTMIMSRLIHHEPLPVGMVPSMVILIAPFEVGFLAYTNFTQHVDTFAGLLFYFGLFVFVTLAFKVFRKGTPFAAGWWAISFPMAALTSASLKYSMFVDAWPVTFIAIALLTLLTIAIAVLFVRTLHFLFNGKLLGA
ncbi:Tellurite resistance protein-like permease [Paraburkholderia piptadeniae]|uniref:Tellurite resistance protein-like permease n=1 Tax=Paraburkholderia piptadeniae TaxID=1701573 RepID=A0A1N7RYH1_9BURK|nr:SLAC1 anion channel family protein [Paraburkholderia piptadeniae]SIT40177.1 Tellurite resistance protein-like permease [Paraburkholderia piptadeniae]